ncbi:hypothetical protein CBR_g20083 [Chara braunii]|uniref:DUF659 domain-containing protein n=1 Tax=Chara braunii TaxID=69332 RepID=A0A388KZP2_CHABU|nr:hypothetical protein CBR_g20083 [Chara braunii]|eukprot:GBG75452.1 hypothetical protein CBR_g20083 [Chara braunii]
MPRKQTREHEPAPEYVQQDYRRKSVVYHYIVVGQKVDKRGVNMLRCTFCNKVFQGTQFYATKHFTQQNYCKKVSDDALYQIAQKCTHRFEADQVQRVRRFAHERGLEVPRSGAMGGEADRPAQGVGEGEDTKRYAEGGVARYGEGGGAAEEDEADVDLEVGVAKGERTLRGKGGMPKSNLMAHPRAVDWERKCGKKGVPPETTCTPSSSKSVVPDRASTPESSKRKERGAQLSGTSAGKRLRQQKMMDTYGGEWIGEWRKTFFCWVYSSGIAFNAFRNTPYRDLQQVALRQPGGALLPVLPSPSEIADMRTVEIHREQLAEELEEEVTRWATDRELPLSWVNAICTDSASAYVGAGRVLASPSMPLELRRITWLPCCVHVCNKLLSDIGTICTSFVDTITRARVLVVFFKTRQAALSFFRKRSATLGLVLSCETRFASVYSMLERLLALQDRLQGMMIAEDGRAWARIPWSNDVRYMARWVRRQIRWSPWWDRMRAIKHVMDPVMDLLRRMDRGGQFMSLVVEWTQDLARLVRDACIPLGQSFSDRIMRRLQARIQHMLKPAHCAAFLPNPRRRDVQYFSAQLDRYHTWLVRQTKRYLLSQTGHDESGGRYLEVCRQFEDFHMQQDRYGSSGGAEAVLERVVAAETARLWSVRRGGLSTGETLWIHPPLAARRGHVDAQARLDVEPVRSGTRSGMTEDEIEEQAALIARDPIGSFAPPPVDSVFGARATIFHPYPGDDDSADERESEAADDPILSILREIDELHEGGDVRDERTHTARRAADQRDMDMMGGEEFLGSFAGTKERSPTAAWEDTRPCTTLREETPPLITASEEPGFPASAPPAPVQHDERSPAPVGREDLGSSLRIRGHGSLFSVARQLVLDSRLSSDLGEMGVHSGAPPVEERERRAEEHGAAGAGGVEGIRGMEEEVAGVVGGVVEVDDGAHVEREEAMARVDDGEQVEAVEGVLPSEVEREDDVVRTQEATMRDGEEDEAVAGVDESVAGSYGAEGLEMPRGSHREKTVEEVTHVSARLVRVRTGAAHVTVVENDPETEPAREEAPQEGDEYRDDEEREDELSDNGDDDSYQNDDDEPSPPPRHGSRRRRGSRRGHDDVDDPSPPGRRETRSSRRRGSFVATAPGRGSVSSTRSTSGARQRGSGKGKGSRRY